MHRIESRPVPVSVAIVGMLTSPTFDSISGNIFIADSSGFLNYASKSFSTAGTCAIGSPPCLGSNRINRSAMHVVTDAPIVDPVTEKVFVFYGNNNNTDAVLQSDVILSASVTASLGSGTGHHLHAGSFDNSCLIGNESLGRLYMCGSSSNSTPTIQRIGFTSSVQGPRQSLRQSCRHHERHRRYRDPRCRNWQCGMFSRDRLFNANAPAATRDQIFFGVQTLRRGTNCGGAGCVMSINVTGIPGTLTITNSIAGSTDPAESSWMAMRTQLPFRNPRASISPGKEIVRVASLMALQ